MKRGKPLARRTRLSPRRKTPRKSARVHDEAYMGRVRGMNCLLRFDPCLLPSAQWPDRPCSGPTHAHHMGVRGFGQKCSDTETVPFCERHHRDWHDCTGPFRGMSKEWRQDYAIRAIRQTQDAIARFGTPRKESDE